VGGFLVFFFFPPSLKICSCSESYPFRIAGPWPVNQARVMLTASVCPLKTFWFGWTEGRNSDRLFHVSIDLCMLLRVTGLMVCLSLFSNWIRRVAPSGLEVLQAFWPCMYSPPEPVALYTPSVNAFGHPCLARLRSLRVPICFSVWKRCGLLCSV
jgi:hypothetical protein